MSRKLLQFWIFKFNSSRLRKSNYKIDIDLETARKNGEAVSVGQNQVIRSLHWLKNKKIDAEEIKRLTLEKKKIKRLPNSKENRERLQKLETQLEEIFFIPEIVSVVISNNRHYPRIIKQGLFINGRRYNRLLCGAGNARRSTVFFVDAEYEQQLKEILNNDRNLEVPLVPSKFNAYFGLYNSATLAVSTPRICVIPDLEIERKVTVDFMVESTQPFTDDKIEEREILNVFNLFDGQGLISPKQSEKWAKEIEIDWTPASWIIRAPFTKGLLVTFDFQEYARLQGISTIRDAWGNEQPIENIDALVSVSQFKLWNCYPSCDAFLESCRKNRLGWGVSRYAPKKDKTHSFTTYQFLQTLNISSEKQVEHLCQDTVDWIEKVSSKDVAYSLLYLLGDVADEKLNEGWFDRIGDPILKAMILEPTVIDDAYVRKHLIASLNRKIHDSYMGVLLLNGANYQMMISDPVAQVQHALGISVTGLLNRGEHYSKYWNGRSVRKVAAIRSPMTWRSENNTLNLQETEEMNFWYRYLYSGIVFNVFGEDCMRMSGAD